MFGHSFKGRNDIFLLHKAHLDVELVEFAGAAVAAGVLVAEARGDLEIAVEARHHQQLLELLRSLRQRIKLARMISGRNKIVSCTLRRRAGQDRRCNFHEIMGNHCRTKICYNLAS